jgi:hypothetical protein
VYNGKITGSCTPPRLLAVPLADHRQSTVLNAFERQHHTCSTHLQSTHTCGQTSAHDTHKPQPGAPEGQSVMCSHATPAQQLPLQPITSTHPRLYPCPPSNPPQHDQSATLPSGNSSSCIHQDHLLKPRAPACRAWHSSRLLAANRSSSSWGCCCRPAAAARCCWCSSSTCCRR